MSDDVYLIEAQYYVQALSTTSNTVGTGAFTFVLTTDVVFNVGDTVVAANADSAGANTMTGTVTSYVSATKTLVLNITSSAGSGTLAVWTIGGVGTLRLCTGKGYVTSPSDTPANTKYYPLIQSKGSLDRSLFASGSTFGRSTIGVGVVTVVNANRALDKIAKYDFAGRPFTILKGTQTSTRLSGFTTLLYGVTGSVEHSWRTINFNINDRLRSVYDKPVQATRFLGNNSLPAGVEGVAGDLLGKPKPILKGFVENFSPPMVNTSKQTFQLSRYQIASIQNVYHGGVTVTAGTNQVSLAALQAGTPTAGQYDYYLGSGSDGAYIRLGTAVTKQITVDATEGASSAARTVAQIANWFLLNPGGVASGDLSSTSITALDSANSAIVGIWIDAVEYTVGQVLDELLPTIGATLVQNRAGTFSLVQFLAPTGSPVVTLNKYKIIDNLNGVERLTSNDPNNGTPAPFCVLNYRKNYTVQSQSDIAAAATDRQQYANAQYRNVVSTINNDIVTKYLLATPWTFSGLFTASGDASTEVARLQTLYGTASELIRVRCNNSDVTAVDLNSLVSVDLPAYTWNGGKLFRVIDMLEDYDANKTVLTLWG